MNWERGSYILALILLGLLIVYVVLAFAFKLQLHP